jgi:hypothetical protein
MVTLTSSQRHLIDRPLDRKIFLEGPAGAGKTTAGVERLLHLVSQGAPAGSILLVVPQRTLAVPYEAVLNSAQLAAGGVASIVTIGGLAQRMVHLFWPLAAARAGFTHPGEPPIFLTLETAQYYMARLVRPLLAEGYFESVAISRNRLYSQILDNLNKAAVVGFPYTEISQRLKSAWVGETSQARIYADAQDCAHRFRQYCLEHNLLDFSLQLEVFVRHLWPDPLCRDYLLGTYQHLVVDNVEEDTPVTHDLLRAWLPDLDSALLIYDTDAGYRRFLGTDPQSGYALRDLCSEQVVFDESFVTPPGLASLGARLGKALGQSVSLPAAPRRARDVLAFEYHRYFPQMLDWVAGKVAELVKTEGASPGEIVILSPFLPDALRFSLADRLARLGIPVRSHRPSRTLREEPAARCLLTLAALAHPAWGLCPSKFDVAYALLQAIEGLDLVRAQLLAEIVYRQKDFTPSLGTFERIKPEVQERITYVLGRRYEALRAWLEDSARKPEEEFDYFLSRLFGEVLSQTGYGFHKDYTAGEVAANLVESARKFRWAIGANLPEDGKPLGKEYLETVQDGVVAAQYIRSWRSQPEDAVLLAPAYTFLMNNRPVDYQFWLDIGSRGWAERLYQPLTQPYVLSRRWPAGRVWTDDDEYHTNQETLYHLVSGLLRRCRSKVYLGLSELNEQGNDQVGPLLKAIQKALSTSPSLREGQSEGSMEGDLV